MIYLDGYYGDILVIFVFFEVDKLGCEFVFVI